MSSWKTPDEVCVFSYNLGSLTSNSFVFSVQIIRIQRLKQRTRALQARLDRPAAKPDANTESAAAPEPQKRKNPFAEYVYQKGDFSKVCV